MRLTAVVVHPVHWQLILFRELFQFPQRRLLPDDPNNKMATMKCSPVLDRTIIDASRPPKSILVHHKIGRQHKWRVELLHFGPVELKHFVTALKQQFLCLGPITDNSVLGRSGNCASLVFNQLLTAAEYLHVRSRSYEVVGLQSTHCAVVKVGLALGQDAGADGGVGAALGAGRIGSCPDANVSFGVALSEGPEHVELAHNFNTRFSIHNKQISGCVHRPQQPKHKNHIRSRCLVAGPQSSVCDWYTVPAGHGTQLLAFLSQQGLSLGQRPILLLVMHWLREGQKCVLAGHASHWLLRVLQKGWLAGHTPMLALLEKHCLKTLSYLQPAGQDTHQPLAGQQWALAAQIPHRPSSVLKMGRSAGHGTHVLVCLFLQVPAGQLMHCLAVASQNWLSGHSWHLLVVVLRYWPARQLWHFLIVGLYNCWSGHLEQASVDQFRKESASHARHCRVPRLNVYSFSSHLKHLLSLQSAKGRSRGHVDMLYLVDISNICSLYFYSPMLPQYHPEAFRLSLKRVFDRSTSPCAFQSWNLAF